MGSDKNTFPESSEEGQGDHLPKASPLWPISVPDLSRLHFLTFASVQRGLISPCLLTPCGNNDA